MEANKPIKRACELQTLSHDHHHALQLCWKIRTGLSKDIAPERIKVYTDWFFKNHLSEHFKLEEKVVFTVLESNNEMVKKAIADHQRLIDLFTSASNTKEILEKIEVDLKAHIRFEERELFTEIQNIATAEQLQKIAEAHGEEKFIEYDRDTFWL